jgi:hypothetical protein
MEIVFSFQTKGKFQTVVADPYLANDPLAEPSSSASLVAPQVRIGSATAVPYKARSGNIQQSLVELHA